MKSGQKRRSFLVAGWLIGYSGTFSSIHRRGRLTTFTWPPFIGAPSLSLSANRPRSGLTGQGRIFDAETVKHVAMKVKPKREEMNERRCDKRRSL